MKRMILVVTLALMAAAIFCQFYCTVDSDPVCSISCTDDYEFEDNIGETECEAKYQEIQAEHDNGCSYLWMDLDL